MTDALPKPLEAYRSYLLLFARARLSPLVRRQLDASDVVQQTLLEGHAGRDAFQGRTSGELAGWLRCALARNLADAVRRLRRAKRDVARERPLQAALDDSSAGLERWLAAEQSSPSIRLQREEARIALADRLAELPDAQQEALLLRYWHGMRVAAIAEAMDRSPEAIAGLLQRGAQALRARGVQR